MSKLATDKQIAFIHKLLVERDAPKLDERTIASFDVRHASQVIESLLALPRKTVVMRPATIDYSAAREQMMALPDAKYALETAGLRPFLVDTALTGDLLFVEVRTFKNHKYIRRLHGAPGSFTRSKFSVEDGVQIVSAIAANPAAAVLAFSVAYTCCACCLAPLTDEASRARGLGPTCAKRFA